jgi:anionic cell wall polymer biosynthesis LytR-Cps2A-Psr (LCP) family protein
MSFQKKKVGGVSTPINRKKYLNPTSMLFASSLLVAVVLILLIAKQVAGFTTTTFNRFTDSTIKLVSQKVGTEMQRDQYGHVNILIAGYAGSDYRGGRLTDTLMLASFNPEL